MSTGGELVGLALAGGALGAQTQWFRLSDAGLELESEVDAGLVGQVEFVAGGSDALGAYSTRASAGAPEVLRYRRFTSIGIRSLEVLPGVADRNTFTLGIDSAASATIWRNADDPVNGSSIEEFTATAGVTPLTFVREVADGGPGALSLVFADPTSGWLIYEDPSGVFAAAPGGAPSALPSFPRGVRGITGIVNGSFGGLVAWEHVDDAGVFLEAYSLAGGSAMRVTASLPHGTSLAPLAVMASFPSGLPPAARIVWSETPSDGGSGAIMSSTLDTDAGSLAWSPATPIGSGAWAGKFHRVTDERGLLSGYGGEMMEVEVNGANGPLVRLPLPTGSSSVVASSGGVGVTWREEVGDGGARFCVSRCR